MWILLLLYNKYDCFIYNYELWELQKENIVKDRGVLVRIHGYMAYTH
jgi:hypothetical protein